MPSAFDQFNTRLGINNPRRKNVGFNFAPFTVGQGQSTPGQSLFEKVGQRKETGAELYNKMRTDSTQRIAADVVDKSANQVQTDEFGIPNLQLTNFSDAFGGQLDAITRRGNLALQTEEAKSNWARLKNLQDLGQYEITGDFQVTGGGTDIPGATANNPGAKAVSLAMKAVKNHTPYVWGGNSLSRGVDCSGLVQQVYRQLGITLPRTTYEQAKSGRRVSTSQLRPGDLVFYNTGSRDPNGIGRYGHVAIYMGNGRVVEAANSRAGLRVNALTSGNGAPALAIRPY